MTDLFPGEWSSDSSVIPRSIFTDPAIYEREMERIFRGPTWHFVAHVSEVPESGDYKRSSIASVPIFIVRGKDGEIRGFLNACAHRGAQIVNEKRGKISNSIRCIYHGWAYDLAGKLNAVGLPSAFPEDFSKEKHGLTSIRIEIFHGCIFATLSDKTSPLESYLGPKVRDLVVQGLGDQELTYLGSQTMKFRCNWKLYAENIFDSYHAQILHGAVRVMRTRSSTDSVADVAYSDDRRFPHAWTRYRSQPIEDEHKDQLNDYSLFEVRGRTVPYSHIVCFFPGDMLSCQLDILQLRFVRPCSVDETEIEFANFARKDDSPDLVEHRVHQGNMLGPSGVISIEDGCALERVQWSSKAGGSNIVVRGLLSDRPPHRYAEEAAVCDFYNAYRTMMNGAPV